MAQANHWRIGLISDLHGNLVSLQATLAALNKLRVTQFLCMGDVATFGPNPNATVALLRELGCPVVMGNTDAWALEPHPFPYRNEETPIIYDIELWGAQQLDADARAFIHTFTPAITLELGSSTILCYHGSPRSNLENVRATTADSDLDTIFAGHHATVAVGGHTHTQMVRRYREMLIVNPGSVGMPVVFAHGATQTAYPPWTEFGVLEVAESVQGVKLHIELHRTPVDVEAILDAVRASDMPHAEWYIQRWRKFNDEQGGA